MNSALYTAYQGMRARQQRLDLIANNIANASTSGFKADRLLYRSVVAAELEATKGTEASGAAGTAANPQTANTNGAAIDPAAATAPNVTTARVTPAGLARDVGVVTAQTTDFSHGSVHETSRSLDVSLEGEGFLVVQTARGERYTRQGSFTLDNAGQLVTQGGDLIVGDSGPITVPPGEVSIGEDGTVTANGKFAGRLKLAQFADLNQALTKEGSSLFVATGRQVATEATGTRVVQGTLEGSNVNSLTEMVAMMQNTREFESLQKAVSTMMNDVGKTVATELGRI
jgi:flagellar basal-body rod protein FlgF